MEAEMMSEMPSAEGYDMTEGSATTDNNQEYCSLYSDLGVLCLFLPCQCLSELVEAWGHPGSTHHSWTMSLSSWLGVVQ